MLKKVEKCRKKGDAMREDEKTFKDYCKEAKKRLKTGFWQDHYKNLDEELERAKNNGLSPSLVKEYYAKKVSQNIRNSKNSQEEFYLKVKEILDREGEVSNVIGLLTDKAYYQTLSYEEKQRYTLELSENYLKALERYKKEKAFLGAK